MNHVIWSNAVDSSPDVLLAYYTTALPGLKQAPSATPDPTRTLLEVATERKMSVWLGLNYNSQWWMNYANDPTWLTREYDLSKAIAAELWTLFGGQFGATIAGFYLPMEIDNVNFPNAILQQRMIDVLADVVTDIHTRTGKPVMTAPFYNAKLGMLAPEFSAWWRRIALASRIDVVSLQDGIGVGHSYAIEQSFAWLRELQDALPPTTSLWSVLETFVYVEGTPMKPAPWSRIQIQIEVESSVVDVVTTFAFTHYQSPQQGFAVQYQQWKNYTDRVSCKK